MREKINYLEIYELVFYETHNKKPSIAYEDLAFYYE
jgi:hypothetical protein